MLKHQPQLTCIHRRFLPVLPPLLPFTTGDGEYVTVSRSSWNRAVKAVQGNGVYYLETSPIILSQLKGLFAIDVPTSNVSLLSVHLAMCALGRLQCDKLVLQAFEHLKTRPVLAQAPWASPPRSAPDDPPPLPRDIYTPHAPPQPTTCPFSLHAINHSPVHHLSKHPTPSLPTREWDSAEPIPFLKGVKYFSQQPQTDSPPSHVTVKAEPLSSPDDHWCDAQAAPSSESNPHPSTKLHLNDPITPVNIKRERHFPSLSPSHSHPSDMAPRTLPSSEAGLSATIRLHPDSNHVPSTIKQEPPHPPSLHAEWGTASPSTAPTAGTYTVTKAPLHTPLPPTIIKLEQPAFVSPSSTHEPRGNAQPPTSTIGGWFTPTKLHHHIAPTINLVKEEHSIYSSSTDPWDDAQPTSASNASPFFTELHHTEPLLPPTIKLDRAFPTSLPPRTNLWATTQPTPSSKAGVHSPSQLPSHNPYTPGPSEVHLSSRPPTHWDSARRSPPVPRERERSPFSFAPSPPTHVTPSTRSPSTTPVRPSAVHRSTSKATTPSRPPTPSHSAQYTPSLVYPTTLPNITYSANALISDYGLHLFCVHTPVVLGQQLVRFESWCTNKLQFNRVGDYHDVQRDTWGSLVKKMMGYMGFLHIHHGVPLQHLSLHWYLDPTALAKFVAFLMARGVQKGNLVQHVYLARKVAKHWAVTYPQAASSQAGAMQRMASFHHSLERQLPRALHNPEPNSRPLPTMGQVCGFVQKLVNKAEASMERRENRWVC